uniref:NADP-dependent oxidoreductase domain-containing protein n=1 Tax=Ditylenchus dipsaci TaxID=166011 RepID=A0A915EGA8_9BILA
MCSQAITFSNGLKMPIVGLGTWQSKPEEIDLAVKTALDAGYRHIDTAARQDIFLVTKLWCTHNRPEDIEAQMKESLAKLKTDYVDLYLVHMPATFNHDMSEHDPKVKVEDIWKGMEGVYEKGLAKSIGVSNFNVDQIERIMKVAKVPIHNTQVELYLYFAQFELQEVCKKHNITLCAYAPIGSPGRKNFVLPTGQKLNWPDAPEPLENFLVLTRHSCDPKSTNKDRVIENFQIFNFQLSQDEVDELNKAPQGSRLFLQDFMVGHPEDPFKEERPKA